MLSQKVLKSTAFVLFMCMLSIYAQAASNPTAIWNAPHASAAATNRLPVDVSALGGPGYNSIGDIFSLVNGDCTVNVVSGQITCTKANGTSFAAVATSGSASDLTTGTLSYLRLPTPTTSQIGGVEAVNHVGSQWVSYIDTAGVPHLSQPQDADLFMQDLVNNNATTSNHGFLKKLSGDAASYMGGDGNWSYPSAFTTTTFAGDGIVLSSTPVNGPHFVASLTTPAANTVLGNGTGSAAAPTYLSVPSCSLASQAIQWLSGSGWACNSAIAAATVTTNANLTGPITSVGNATAVAGAAAGQVYAGATPSFTATPVLGVNASTAGTLGLANGGGSGATVTLQNVGATSAYNWNYPTTAGANGALLTSGGGTSTAMVWLTDVATGQILTSGGVGTIPAFSSTLPFTLPAGQGGTGQTSIANAFTSFFESVATTLGDIVYGGGSGAPTRLAGNTTSTTKFLTQTGTGTVSAAPSWTQPSCSSLSNGASGCSTATGTSGATIPLLNAANTWSGVQTITKSDFALLGTSTGATTLNSGLSGAGNNTLTLPTTSSDTLAGLGTAQTFTAVQTITNADLALLGTSTGKTILNSGLTGAGNNTLILPTESSDTLVDLTGSQSLTNKSIAGSEINSGLVTVGVGGTGVSNPTAHYVMVSEGSSAMTPVSPTSNTGYVLTSNGTGSDPSFQAPSAGTVINNEIGGFVISSISGTSTTASFTISAGTAADGGNTVYITKNTTTSWAASNGNAINGTDAASSTLANSTTYHVFMCTGGSGTGSFVSASLTPTCPTGYATAKRRIGSFTTNGSGAPIAYTSIEVEGGAVINWLATQVLDVTGTTTTANRTLYTLSVPSGVKMGWLYRLELSNTASSGTIITSPDETDVAPGATSNGTTAPGNDANGVTSLTNGVPRDGNVTTNTSGQIGVRSNAAASVYGTTRGWKDFRRS